jgi:hypothetical protein
MNLNVIMFCLQLNICVQFIEGIGRVNEILI